MLLDVDARRSLVALGPQGDARIYTFFHESLNEISQLTGVTAASISNFTPISGGIWSQGVVVDGQRQGESPVFFAVSPEYFKTSRFRSSQVANLLSAMMAALCRWS